MQTNDQLAIIGIPVLSVPEDKGDTGRIVRAVAVCCPWEKAFLVDRMVCSSRLPGANSS